MKIKMPLVNRLVTAEQMRALDRRATEEYTIPSLLLMENAGRAVFQAADELLGGASARTVLVVAGQGNNGGDGFVAARHLHNAGALVTVAYYGDRDNAKGDALLNIQIAERIAAKAGSTFQLKASPSETELQQLVADSDLVIDALLGTGIKGEVREPLASVIKCIAVSPRPPILSVDIPSGVDADTGTFVGPVVHADVTVTFALPKIGLVTYPGAAKVGELVVADIGIPADALQDCGSQTRLLDWHQAIGATKPRAPDAHKGTFGHLAIVAGSVGMTGAAALAAEGALRIGTGLVTLAVPESLNDIMEAKLTEAMTIPIPESSARAFGMASLDRALETIEKRDAAVIGPGFGRDGDTIAFTLELVRRLHRPAIIDADALFALSTDLDVLKNCEAPLVVTPHPGEMAALLGTTAPEVQSNRLEVSRSFAAEYGVTVVLKGAGTVVAAPGGRAFVNTTGTPGMASGGVGDVLSGLIGGFLARSWDPIDAASAAVYLHARAGEIAGEKLGEEAMIASDVANSLSDAVQEVKQQAAEKGVSHH